MTLHHHGTSPSSSRHHANPQRTHHLRTITLHVGGLHASKKPVHIKTILGSCISACLFDPTNTVGGMNHFMLPGVAGLDDTSTRYGINAMEVLINEMMKLGANRKTLYAKVFGGADIFHADHPLMMVGAKNIAFIRNFLTMEGISIVSQRLGGHQGIIVHYMPHTFEVLIKPVAVDKFQRTEEEELEYRNKLLKQIKRHDSDNITLF
jgi:chemotaxis receptor (MCP) glutamine deamidase CheD